MSIYQDIILDHYRAPRNFGHIDHPSVTSSLSNPSCGDKIQVDIVLEKDKIAQIKFSGHGCAISTAAASLLTEYVKEKSPDLLQELDRAFMIKLLGIELSPNRIKCALLPLEAIIKAYGQSKTKRSS